MNFQLIRRDVPKLVIDNKFAIPGVVLIFPITRASGLTNGSWHKFMELIEQSSLHAIVIIDKTPFQTATSFFQEQHLEKNCPVYLVQRDPLEGIFDSQKIITLDSNLWIAQVHDDDDWSGAIALPDFASQDTVYVPLISDKNHSYELVDSTKIPAHTLFSLVPHRLWNSFTAYIAAQGGHIAPSADSSLSLVSQKYFQHKRLERFNYHYSARHWEGRKTISRELTKLSNIDGWGVIAGVSAAVLTSHLDQICFMIFMAEQDGLPLKNHQLDTLVEKVASSKKSRFFKLIRIGSIQGLVKEKSLLSIPYLRIPWSSRLPQYILKIRFELALAKVCDLESLKQLLNQIRFLDLTGSLNTRLDFWSLTITKVMDN